MAPSQHVLILGAGELGSAIIESLLTHPAYNKSTTSLSLAIRASTLALVPSSPPSSSSTNTQTQQRLNYLSTLRSQHNVSLIPVDLTTSSFNDLTLLFTAYTTVIHAGGMTLPPGTQLKVTRAVLAAKCTEYIPWQWGVDYDAIGPEGGLGLFAEQCAVRELLRSQTPGSGNDASPETKWVIVSCGVFMSFLFEAFWGVVVYADPESEGTSIIPNPDANTNAAAKENVPKQKAKRITGIRALGGWNHNITATTASDIARCNAELVLRDTGTRGKAVYIAGDTMSYSAFADLVQQVSGGQAELTREVWTTEWLKQQAAQAADEEEKKLWKYRVVFSEDIGLSWSKRGTYSDDKGIEMEGVEEWMRMNML